MELTKISKFSQNLILKETMSTIKGGQAGSDNFYQDTIVYDTCTLSAGDNQEDGDDPSIYQDPG